MELRLYYDWDAETVCGVVVHTSGWYGTYFNTGVRVTSPWDSQADWGYFAYYAGPRTVPLGHTECVSTTTVDEADEWYDSFC
ncbi:hypothetical protein [Streptomyces sp. NPDC021224]|uniref:hypothetical protein n=1 Tax=unclassified Streptomyces TaxID=2593676 RepID=UPI00379D8F6E